MNSTEKIQNLIEYEFKNETLLIQALTHQSYANDHNTTSYERLEFLGDAVIELIVSDYIYNNFSIDAGSSTKLRASLVSTDYLCKVSKNLELEKFAIKSKSLQQMSKKNIADLFESLIGAVYVDGGYDAAKKIVDKFVLVDQENVAFVIKNTIDYKSKLQEYCQGKSMKFEYILVSSSGLDHEKIFEVALKIDGKIVAKSIGKSIHSAEEKCAEMYLS